MINRAFIKIIFVQGNTQVNHQDSTVTLNPVFHDLSFLDLLWKQLELYSGESQRSIFDDFVYTIEDARLQALKNMLVLK